MEKSNQTETVTGIGFISDGVNPAARRWLLLTATQWLLAVVAGFGAALLMLPLYLPVSGWLAVPVFLVGVVVVHMRYASRFIIPFPHIALLIAALQYVFAAWLSVWFPNANPVYNIGARLSEYLPFASLVLLASAAGWAVGLHRMRLDHSPTPQRVTPQLLYVLDGLMVLGFLGVFAERYAKDTGFGFVILLVANLRFVAVFGRMLCRVRGWGWRLVLVTAMEVLYASESTMFHGLILWLFWSFALWVFVRKPNWPVILLACVTATLLLPALQESKGQLREQLGETGAETSVFSKRLSSWEKASLWLSLLEQSLRRTLTGKMDADFVSDMLIRYNQGWIVDKIMLHVPENEPFAHGQTLKNAALAALVPRVFFPDKPMTGGRAQMRQYAGLELTDETSMNLGYAGEMYANFGYWGGIMGCGVYWLLFALAFRWVCRRAFVSPLWWSIVPYVGFSALKAEDGIVGILNWTSKACLMVVLVCLIFPAFRHALFPAKQGATRPPRSRRQGRKHAPTSPVALVAPSAKET